MPAFFILGQRVHVYTWLVGQCNGDIGWYFQLAVSVVCYELPLCTVAFCVHAVEWPAVHVPSTQGRVAITEAGCTR